MKTEELDSTSNQQGETKPYDFGGHVRKSLGEYGTDEEYGAAFDTMKKERDDFKTKAEEYELNSRQVSAIIAENPEAEELLRALLDGKPFVIAVLEAGVTKEDLEIAEGEDGYERYNELNTQRKEKATARAAREKELEEDTKLFMQDYEAFAKETFGDSADEAKGFDAFADDFIAKFLSGKARKAELVKLHQAYTYEEDVAEAAESGKIEGKNEQIVSKKKKESERVSDGLPVMTSGQVASEKPSMKRTGVIPPPHKVTRV